MESTMKENRWLIVALILGPILGWIASEYKSRDSTTQNAIPNASSQTEVRRVVTPSVDLKPVEQPITIAKKIETETPMVYVCLGRYSKKFHWRRDCHGLRGCKGGVKRVTLARAKYIGRRLCGFED
jgi:hypothetical protein